MSKKLKKIVTVLMAITMLVSFSVVTYAAEKPGNNKENIIEKSSVTRMTRHKVNSSVTQVGGMMTYTSTTTRTCTTLTADGNLLGNNTGGNSATVYVSKGGVVVASGTIPLDGKEHTLSRMVGTNYPAGTYTIRVQPTFAGAYDLATSFYY